MPKYAALIYSPAETEGTATPEEMEKVMSEYMQFSNDVATAGVMAYGAALENTATATTVHVEGGKGGRVVHTDGPFAETKEVLGGFYILECADLDEALGWAVQTPGAWYGKVEVRPVFEPPGPG